MTFSGSVGRAPLEREASDHWSLLGACTLGAAALKSLDFVILRILRGLSQVRSSLTREFPALLQLPCKCESLKKEFVGEKLAYTARKPRVGSRDQVWDKCSGEGRLWASPWSIFLGFWSSCAGTSVGADEQTVPGSLEVILHPPFFWL